MAKPDQTEALATEEILATVDDIRDEVMGQSKRAAICGKAVMNSKLTFSNIDYRTASIYLAVTLTEEE